MFSTQTIPDVEVDYDRQAVLVDGEYFPWAIANDSVQTRFGESEVATVTLTMFASSLKITKNGETVQFSKLD